ncbi:hypothetical protein DPMN_148400 [Dreissena polymorpha]|uniref:Uncharacterized protein n=1 Tax=Dreissena polymorpha TaxID=45954 RepID=A0A9D4FAS9_DREPO|nr:hypothetical protein DPMN_148400 [Dreissena polymorpha]
MYLRVTDHVRWVQAPTADPMKPLMSEARAKTGRKVKKTKPRNYYSCSLCERSMIDRLRHLEQDNTTLSRADAADAADAAIIRFIERTDLKRVVLTRVVCKQTT